MRDGGLGFFARALSFTIFSSLRTAIHSPTTPRLGILLFSCFLSFFFFGHLGHGFVSITSVWKFLDI